MDATTERPYVVETGAGSSDGQTIPVVVLRVLLYPWIAGVDLDGRPVRFWSERRWRDIASPLRQRSWHRPIVALVPAEDVYLG